MKNRKPKLRMMLSIDDALRAALQVPPEKKPPKKPAKRKPAKKK